MSEPIWDECQAYLRDELTAQQFNTWIRPLKAEKSERSLALFAPNRFVKDWVKNKYLARIEELVAQTSGQHLMVDVDVNAASGGMRHQMRAVPMRSTPTETRITSPRPQNAQGDVQQSISSGIGEYSSSESRHAAFEGRSVGHTEAGAFQTVGRMQQGDALSRASLPDGGNTQSQPQLDLLSEHSHDFTPSPSFQEPVNPIERRNKKERSVQVEGGIQHQSFLNPNFTFEAFVEGKSNQLAHAAAKQVAQNAGGSYNPLFIYGGVGLGKTHLMHAVGNAIAQFKPGAKVVYLHSERFVADMVKALQLNAINEFKRYYRSVDALLIDDIQFFAGKERSQEEFFHTFNALLEGGQQIILTCDRYPKDIDGLEERLKSRFGWGLTVAVEPPELETRVAILMKKAEQEGIDLPHEAAFFVAQKIRSNVRELEGALKRVIANAEFTGAAITLPFIKESLKDLLASHEKQVSIDNIQRVVADYYKLKVSDLLSKRRTRSIARPRQLAMALSKELTNHSLPEIGDAFGGRDHTTVLHACRKIKELNETNADIREDYNNLFRSLTT